MNSGDNGTLPTELSNAINGTFEPAIDQLKANGNLTTGVGSYSNAIAQMSFASSIGGKNANDDFIAFFNPTDDTAFDWAAAIADGVSGSLLGDVASELACITALSSLAKNPEQIINAAHPVSEANRALRQIGSTFENDPERYCPSGIPASIWKRALQAGKVLQTTLILIWSVENQIQIVAVGDGGLLYSVRSNENAFAVHEFGSGKLSCIGPKNVPHDVEAYQIDDWSCLACFTDGLTEVAKKVEAFSTTLFDGSSNSAHEALEFVNGQHPELAEDNLTVFRLIRQSNE